MKNHIKYCIKKKSISTFLVAFVLMLFSCENDLEVIKTITTTTNLPKIVSEDIEVVYTDSAKVQIKIEAPKLELIENSPEDKYFEFREGILIYFYNPDQTINSKLKANYAIYRETKNLWEARDNVVAINQDGEILKTEQLFWNEEEKRIYTKKWAKIIGDNYQIEGIGFEADENLTNWEFKKVRGPIYFENNE